MYDNFEYIDMLSKVHPKISNFELRFQEQWLAEINSIFELQSEYKELYSYISQFSQRLEHILKPYQPLNEKIIQLTSSIVESYNASPIHKEAIQVFSSIAKSCDLSFITAASSAAISTMVESRQNKYIELTEDDCASINTIFAYSNVSNSSFKITKRQMTLTEFIKTVLIPILAILAPMLLTIYYHKIDSIESQKHHLKELQLKEEELRIREQQLQNDIEQTEILKNILIEIQNFPEYLESLQVDPECPSEVPLFYGEAPEPPGEAPDCSDAAADESGNQ